MLFSGAWVKMIHEKTWSKELCDTVPLIFLFSTPCMQADREGGVDPTGQQRKKAWDSANVFPFLDGTVSWSSTCVCGDVVWPPRGLWWTPPSPSPPSTLPRGTSQSRQSAKLFLQSLELGLPQPLTRRRVRPPTFGSRGRGTLAGERGGGRVPIPTREHIVWYSVYICTLWGTCSIFIHDHMKKEIAEEENTRRCRH